MQIETICMQYQIVSDGDNLHAISNPVFQKKKRKEKYHQFVIYWISQQSVKVKR